jgi:hypothetical protein
MTSREPEDGILAPSARVNLEASRRAVAEWERSHPIGIEETLDWVDQLRILFGDAPVDRRPWRGDDFRL